MGLRIIFVIIDKNKLGIISIINDTGILKMSEATVNKRVLLTKKLIKNSLIEILETKGIQKVTVTEICTNAQINRSTFYAYYNSPYDLMSAIKMDIISDTEKLLEDCPELPPEKRLKFLLEKHLNYLSSHLKEFMAFSSDIGEDFSLPAQTMEIILTPYLNVILNERYNEKQREMIKIFSIYGTIGIVKNWIKSSQNISVKDLSNSIQKLIDELVKN